MSERTTIGIYRVLRMLGQGGMGEVYLAQDPRLGREVAIKVLGARALGSEEARRRFEREARTAAQLSHPNIVHIYEVGDDDGVAYIVMERVEGRTLRDLIAEGPLSVERVLHLAEGIADGLAAAHERGIVHRDIKPANILVEPSGRPRILDFGLAKALDAGAEDASGADDDRSTISHITQARKVMGTVAYMSPEQAAGKPLDPRSDVFSFGVLLYQMCSGHLPFEGDSDITTLVAILRDSPASLSSWSRDVPVELERIVFRCLEKRAEDRYQVTGELLEDLRAMCRDADWHASRTRTTDKMRAAAAALRVETRQHAAAERRWARISAFAAVIAAGLALVLFPLAGSKWKTQASDPLDAVRAGRTSIMPVPPVPALPPSAASTPDPLEVRLEQLGPSVEEIRFAVEQAVHAHKDAFRALRGLPTEMGGGDGTRVLAILGFRNQTGDASLDWVSSGLPEILITDLSDLDGIRLVGTRKMSDLAARAGASWEKGVPPKLGWRLAQEADADLLLTGSLFKNSEGLRLDASLEDMRDGTVVFSEKQLGDDVFELADELTKSLRSRVGKAPAAAESASAAAVSPVTSSVPAMAEFTRGMTEFNRFESAQAIPHLQKAVRLDPEFLLARLRLLQCYRQEGRRAEARDQIQFLQQRKERLGRKYAELVELYAADEQMSLERILRAAQALERDAGDDPEIGIIVCRMRARIGKLQGDEDKTAEALDCLRQIYAKDPLFAPAVQAYATALDLTDQREKAIALLADYVKARPEDPRMRTLYAQALQNDHHLESAARELEAAVEQRPQDSFVLSALAELSRRLEHFEDAEKWLSRLLQTKNLPALVKAATQEAQLQAARGHIDAALAVARKGAALARTGGDPVAAVKLQTQAADLLLALGRTEEAWKLSEQFLQAAPNKDTVLSVDAAVYAYAAGHRERAEELQERALAALDGDAAQKLSGIFEQSLELAESTADGDVDTAIPLAESVRRAEPESLYYPLVRLALEKGKLDWAIGYLRAWLSRSSDPSDPCRIFVHYLLGQAEQANGRPREAMAAYREFLHWWKDGDRSIEAIPDAEKRLASLEKNCAASGKPECAEAATAAPRNPG
jgi:tetratricopeptide (TPR) repeat protein/predicted Ser/Thr protein kinase